MIIDHNNYYYLVLALTLVSDYVGRTKAEDV